MKDITDAVTALKNAGVPVEKLSTNALDEPTKELGKGFGNLFWLVFSPLHAARAALEPRIKAYQQRITRELEKIPAKNLVEPPLNIIGPALEASKFYIENEELQGMFAKLIASASNREFQKSAHPSFVEVIKQLSPFDAQILNYIDQHSDKLGVGRIVGTYRGEKLKEHLTVISFPFFPFPEMNINNLSMHQESVTNLIRLGLISVDEDKYFRDENRYSEMDSHPVVKQYQERTSEFKLDIGHIISRIYVEHKYWEFTPFGKKFIQCCLSND